MTTKVKQHRRWQRKRRQYACFEAHALTAHGQKKQARPAWRAAAAGRCARYTQPRSLTACVNHSATQVLDARDPEGCRCPDVERYVRSLDPNKRVILLLNKMGELRS